MMTGRIPVRFNRIAAAFDEAARAPPVRLCESSGSDHSPDELSNLSDLVNSFIESHFGVEISDQGQEMGNQNDGSNSEGYYSDSETKNSLEGLVAEEDDDDKQKIRLETELALRSISNMSLSEGFKRRLMSRLREMGFDAGLCKCRWEKFGQHPSGSYEYIDINASGIRYIVEVNLAGQFEIARPTTRYDSLIDIFPKIFVGKPEELKKVVRLMSRTMRESMKSAGLKVPPWRRNGYMQAKWFSHYKRTTNEISAKMASSSQRHDAVANRRLVGFETLTMVSYHCKDDFASNVVPRVGYLSAAFTANDSIGLQL